jgi:sugar phosphate isomerase/epimerase
MSAKSRVGIQLIIFGKQPSTDLPSVLQAAHQAGYDGIEAGNLAGAHPVTELKRLLSDHHLVIAGAHAGFGDIQNRDRLKANVDYLNQMGSSYLMCSGVAPGDTIDAYYQSADVFNEAGAYCKHQGVTLCYHNHNWEFTQFPTAHGPVTAIHELCARTDPDSLKLCIDVFWVAVGGEDPAAVIHRYASRAAYFHFKDGLWDAGHPGKVTRFLELGHGSVDLNSALQAALSVNPAWIVTEQDTPNDRPADVCATESRVYLKGLGL